MPLYSFQGRRETTGEVISGMREAASHATLGQDLLTEGILLTRFDEQKQTVAGSLPLSGLLKRVPVLERVLFARYFALMLRAGLDVKQALGVLSQQTRNKTFGAALVAVGQSI